MTNKEAAKMLITKMHLARNGGLCVMEQDVDTFLDAIYVSLSFLLKQDGTTTSIPKCGPKQSEEKKCDCKGENDRKVRWYTNSLEKPPKKGMYDVISYQSNSPFRAYYNGQRWLGISTQSLPIENVACWREIDS